MDDSEIVEFTITIELLPIDNDIPNENSNSSGIPIYVYILSGVTVIGSGVGFYFFKKFKL